MGFKDELTVTITGRFIKVLFPVEITEYICVIE